MPRKFILMIPLAIITDNNKIIIEIRDVTTILDNITNTEQQQTEHIKKTIKKAKWHLGIRSQSKPQDIMHEVFKAMKTSGMVIVF